MRKIFFAAIVFIAEKAQVHMYQVGNREQSATDSTSADYCYAKFSK